MLGLALAPGVVYQPDPEELHLVRPAVGLTPDARGRIALRLTDNLEEVTYVDRVAVRAVDHPTGTVVLPREGLRPTPPYPVPTLHLMEKLLPPVATREGGSDPVLWYDMGGTDSRVRAVKANAQDHQCTY